MNHFHGYTVGSREIKPALGCTAPRLQLIPAACLSSFFKAGRGQNFTALPAGGKCRPQGPAVGEVGVAQRMRRQGAGLWEGLRLA